MTNLVEGKIQERGESCWSDTPGCGDKISCTGGGIDFRLEAGVHLHSEGEVTGEISYEICGHEFQVKPAGSLCDFFLVTFSCKAVDVE